MGMEMKREMHKEWTLQMNQKKKQITMKEKCMKVCFDTV